VLVLVLVLALALALALATLAGPRRGSGLPVVHLVLCATANLESTQFRQESSFCRLATAKKKNTKQRRNFIFRF
jgi:hypothetical protein